jgi:trimeric autotransporter adhesin
MKRLVIIGLMIWNLGVTYSVNAVDNKSSFAKGGNEELILRSFPIERLLSYQGILKDNSANPVGDGNYNLTFRLYNQTSGGTLLWTSSVTQITTKDGYFVTQLGPIPLRFDSTYYLSIQVQGDAEMSQRQRLTATPYSASSDTSNYSFMTDSSRVAMSVIDNSITSSKIVNGTIQFLDIGQNGAANGQVMKWNGSAWSAGNDSLGGGSNWNQAGNVLYTNNFLGLAKGGSHSALLGTAGNSHVNFGASCTTGTSGNNYSYCTVSGGYGNAVSSNYGFIGGGLRNAALGTYSVISGGSCDSASGDYCFVGGGQYNVASNNYSVVAGGSSNKATGEGSSIGGGIINHAYGINSFVGGGWSNTSQNYAAVGGGMYNSANGSTSAITGGYHNTTSDDFSFIGGGYYNGVYSANSSICGGQMNSISGDNSCIPGGRADTITTAGNYSMVFGQGVYNDNDYRIVLFDSLNDGSLNINRDGRDGTVTTYPIQVGTNTSNGNGAYLTTGGVWTNGSSRTFKENFTPFNGDELLSKISNLSVTSYNYRGTTEKHIGPVAEEFVGAFDTGVIRETDGKRDDMYLSSGDVAGVALAGVQELIKQSQVLKSENENMKTKIDNLERRLSELERNSR